MQTFVETEHFVLFPEFVPLLIEWLHAPAVGGVKMPRKLYVERSFKERELKGNKFAKVLQERIIEV